MVLNKFLKEPLIKVSVLTIHEGQSLALFKCGKNIISVSLHPRLSFHIFFQFSFSNAIIDTISNLICCVQGCYGLIFAWIIEYQSSIIRYLGRIRTKYISLFILWKQIPAARFQKSILVNSRDFVFFFFW